MNKDLKDIIEYSETEIEEAEKSCPYPLSASSRDRKIRQIKIEAYNNIVKILKADEKEHIRKAYLQLQDASEKLKQEAYLSPDKLKMTIDI